MRLIHLAAGRRHVVWAVCDGNGRCQVLERLMKVTEEYPDLADAMMALLFEVLPETGPPLEDSHRAKRLYRDLLYELKADREGGRKEHLGLRVAFFFDGPAVIVCTNAFYKTSSTPPEDLDAALTERLRYFEAKQRNQLDFELLKASDRG